MNHEGSKSSESLKPIVEHGPRRNRTWGYLSALVTPFAICLVIVLYVNWKSNRSLQDMRAALTDRDIPVEYWDINKRWENQPPGENGAKYFVSADMLWKKKDFSIRAFDPPGFPRFGQPLDSEYVQKIRSALGDNYEALKLIDASGNAEYAQFYVWYDPYDYNYTDALYHTSEAAFYTQLRCLEAQSRGAIEDSVDYLLDILRISETLDSSHCLEASESTANHNGELYESLEDMLGRVEIGPSQLEHIDEAIERRISKLDPVQAVRVEIALEFQRIAYPRFYYQNWYTGLWHAASSGWARSQDLINLREIIELHDNLPNLPLIDLAWLPIIDRYASQRSAHVNMRRSVRILSKLHESTVRLQLARVAIALDQHRQENGVWPESIIYLPLSIQIDPSSGRPWGLKSNDFGVTVYSMGRLYYSGSGKIGKDGITSGAIQFRLLNPEYRGRLPKLRQDD